MCIEKTERTHVIDVGKLTYLVRTDNIRDHSLDFFGNLEIYKWRISPDMRTIFNVFRNDRKRRSLFENFEKWIVSMSSSCDSVLNTGNSLVLEAFIMTDLNLSSELWYWKETTLVFVIVKISIQLYPIDLLEGGQSKYQLSSSTQFSILDVPS